MPVCLKKLMHALILKLEGVLFISASASMLVQGNDCLVLAWAD